MLFYVSGQGRAEKVTFLTRLEDASPWTQSPAHMHPPKRKAKNVI